MQYKLKPVSASMQLKLTKAVVTKVFIKDISLYKQYDVSESVCCLHSANFLDMLDRHSNIKCYHWIKKSLVYH